MDLSLTFGGDLALDPTGDLLLASDTTATQQRVLRRILTNTGRYIQHPDYGAGIGQFVGQPSAARRIQALVRQQMKREQGVARTPAPSVSVRSNTLGVFTMQVRYTDLATGQTVTATGTPGY